MNKKIKIAFIIILFFVIMFVTNKVFANNLASKIGVPEYTEDYKRWLELSEEEKEKVIKPRVYEIPKTSIKYNNPLKFTRMLGINYEPNFSLRSYIPKNVKVRDQMDTDTCWAFSAISSLETNLALKNYYKDSSAEEIEYDFSERHMDYATTREFSNGINKFGFNRNAGGLGNFYISLTYLTNGMGAIREEDMPFDGTTSQINIEEIQNKEVVTTVYDTINYPSYNITDDLTEIKEQMKYHIKNYGSIEAGICGSLVDEFYNNVTGAVYYNDDNSYPMNHVVSIIGWDDNYSIDNFSQSNQPQHEGAWIVKNSEGTILDSTSIDDIKQMYFANYNEECVNRGWEEASDITNEFIEELIRINRLNLRIEGDTVIEPLGDDGIMYVSYEDVNIYKYLHGITNASDSVDYENIYQYNEITNEGAVQFDNTPKLYVANKFEKETEGDEYLTCVSIYAPEEYKCKVYVNSDGDSLTSESLKPVELKAGNFETFQSGYHTLEFANPVKINSEKFAVAIEIDDEIENSIILALETDIPGESNNYDDYIITETGKCFISEDANSWLDLSEMSQANSELPDGDSTIKAFTISSVPDTSLDRIEVTRSPSVIYVEGDSLSKSQIEVTAYYNGGRSPEVIENYTIENGNNLQRGENQVIIKYTDEQDGKEAQTTLTITAEENSVTGIYVDSQPTNKIYTVGDEFNPDGMVIKATYKRGEPRVLLSSEYVIVDGQSLVLNQNNVTIKYKDNEAITTQVEGITVNPPNPSITGISITEYPRRVYYEGETFDSSGMKVVAIYDYGDPQDVTSECTIQDLGILSTENDSVEISYQGHKDSMTITVNPNTITEIRVTTEPKTEYEEGEIFNPEGMVVVAVYEYGDPVDITSECTIEDLGVLNENTTLTITYNEVYTTTLDITVNKKVVELAQNSNFENIKLNIKSIKAYYYTDTSKESYAIVDIEVEGIEKAEGNDTYEYYYYLSPDKSETNISSWIKILDGRVENGKLSFTMDTRDFENYDQASDSDKVNLYLREIVTKGEDQSIVVTNPIEFEPDDKVPVEVYIDDKKFEDIDFDIEEPEEEKEVENKKEDDDTIADRIFPDTGSKIAFAGVVIILSYGIVKFVKYKKLKEIK